MSGFSFYEEFLTRRHELPLEENLQVYYNKIDLRERLLQEVLGHTDVRHTPLIHMSREDPEIRAALAGRESYVVKPAHMSEGEHVFVVLEGRPKFPIMLNGSRQEVHELDLAAYIQAQVSSAWTISAGCAMRFDCSALLDTGRGVIVEELVLGNFPGSPARSVLEVRAHVVWGLTMFVEFTFDQVGSYIFRRLPTGHAYEGSQGGWTFDTLNQEEGKLFPPIDIHNLISCIEKANEIAEQVADAAANDHLRVDLLVQGEC